MKRHPELSKRKPQALQMVRAKAATPEVVNHWFHQCLKPALASLGMKMVRMGMEVGIVVREVKMTTGMRIMKQVTRVRKAQMMMIMDQVMKTKGKYNSIMDWKH